MRPIAAWFISTSSAHVLGAVRGPPHATTGTACCGYPLQSPRQSTVPEGAHEGPLPWTLPVFGTPFAFSSGVFSPIKECLMSDTNEQQTNENQTRSTQEKKDEGKEPKAHAGA